MNGPQINADNTTKCRNQTLERPVGGRRSQELGRGLGFRERDEWV